MSDRSAFVQAQADDPELAALMADAPSSRYPELSEWTPEHARLTDIFDRLGELIATTVAVAGGKPGSIPLSPRPRTAIDRGRAAAARSRRDSLVAEVMEAQERWAAAHEGG